MNQSWAKWAGAIVLAAAPAGRADTLLKGLAGSNPIAEAGVKVTGVANGSLTYTTAAGGSRSVPLDRVQKLTVDGQPSFDAAEDAFAAGNAAAALSGYQSAVDGTGPAWLKARAAQRLAGVARRLHRYDAEVAAYAALVVADPATAATVRPTAPPHNDPYLDAAATAVTRALASASGASQKADLLGVQLDIQQAKGDKAAVAQTLQQLVAAGGATPGVQARLKLATAEAALDDKQYAQAESAIQQNRALFADPAQQVDALFVLAQARDGQAVAGNDALKDLALAYLRVVTFGSDLPDRPHVADALLRAAEIQEKLGNTAGAKTLYQQLATDRAYGGTPAAADAHTALDRLKK